MSPKQKLDDLIALRDALQSQRRWVIQARGDRSRRYAKIRAAVQTIKTCRVTIAAAWSEIMLLRDYASMDTQAEKLDKRIAELTQQIGRLDKTNVVAQMQEKMRKMQAEIRRLNAELPVEFKLADIL